MGSQWEKRTYEVWCDSITSAYHMLGKHKDELKEARRFRNEHPENWELLGNEARALAAMGKTGEINNLIDESLTFTQTADSNSGWIMINAGCELGTHGFRKDSKQVLDRAVGWLQERPKEELETTTCRYELAQAFYFAGKYEEAKRLSTGLVNENPGNIDYLGYSGCASARLGNREEALKIGTQLEEIKVPFPEGLHTYYRACIAAILGEKETAVRLLREAIGQGVYYWQLYWDPDLDSLRDYPAFKELIKPRG
jgi:tetratricopeptide (TPR) repeat protein